MSVNWYRYLDTLTVFRSLSLPPGSSVGDVGCGSGHMSILIAPDYNVYGIDKEVNNKNDLVKKGVSVFRCDIEVEQLPFEDNFFDCVMMLEVIEHLDPRKLQFVLGEIYRTLTNRGVLLLSTPNQSSIQNVIRLFLGRRTLFAPDHVREYVMEEMIKELKNAGFNIHIKKYLLSYDKTTYTGEEISPPTHVLRGWLSYRNITNIGRVLLYPIKLLVPRFRSLILIVARKADDKIPNRRYSP